MTDFTPSPLQAQAIRDIKEWFENRTDEQPVFRVWGYAGTGKTTITKHAIAELGLDTMTRATGRQLSRITGGVLYAAFTGKAALVMTRKGTPASTIHSLIYRVSEATKEEIERVKEDIAAIKAKLPTLGQRERFLEESRLRSLEIRLDDIHKPRFVLNEQSIVRDAKLIVLDEVSMVGEEMARDLLAFGKPILVLGDPGQLPPIKGDGAFTSGRAGRHADRDPPPGRRERHHPPRHHGPAGPADPLRRARRLRLEDAPRPGGPGADAARRPGDLRAQRHPHPAQHGDEGGRRLPGRLSERRGRNGHAEKIICLKNRNDIGVVNGMFLELSDVRDETEHCFSAVVRSEDGETLGAGGERHFIYKGHFEDHVAPDRERERRDHWIKKGLIEAVWGYAITCHKAQGSALAQRHRLRRRSRPHRRGPGPLALHRDHPRRERAGDP